VRTERGLDRLVTLVDAVVAIAITLLVLPLIELLAEGGEQDLGTLLVEERAQFGAFALSFVVIARLWLAHHRIVESVGGYDPIFSWLNFAWAFTIVIVPFTTQVVAEFGTDRLSVGLYVGTIAAGSALTTLLTVLVQRRPHLRRTSVAAADVLVTPALVTTGLLVVALVVGVALPAANFWALLLLWLSGPVERLVGRWWARPRSVARRGLRAQHRGQDVEDDDQREGPPR